MSIVDSHAHAIAEDFQRYPISPVDGQQSEWSIEHPVNATQLIEHMDRAGVQKTVLVQASSVYGYDNSYTIDCVAAHPDRFVGVCCIDATAPDAADVLGQMVQEHGMSGVRLFTQNDPSWINQEIARPFWTKATELNIPVNVALQYRGLANLASAAEQNPDVSILLDHLANAPIDDGPPYEQAGALFDLASRPNIRVKFSTYNLHDAAQGDSTVRQFFERLISTFGADRVIWGSNFPASWGDDASDPYKDLVDLGRDGLSFLDKSDFQLVMGGNARRIYPALGSGQ
jgi:L-fuconolactonase